MPQITVWCLPPDLTEERLRELHKRIVAAAVSIMELGLNGEQDFLTVFPPDMMKYGAGTEIMVQVSELWEKPERTPEVRNRLARALGEGVKEMFPEALVAVRLDPPFDPKRDGFWASNMPSLALLQMPIKEFFSRERFRELGFSSWMAGHAHITAQNGAGYLPPSSRRGPFTTVADFLEKFPDSRTTKVIRGPKAREAIVTAIKAAQLPFSD
jgi:hypothetical protein